MVQRRRMGGTERSLWEGGEERGPNHPAPNNERPIHPSQEIRSRRVSGGSAGKTGAGRQTGRRRTWGISHRRLRPVEVRGGERDMGGSEIFGLRCPTPLNNKASGSGRQEAAFAATGTRAFVTKDLDSSVKGREVFLQEGRGRFGGLETLDGTSETRRLGHDGGGSGLSLIHI